MRKQNNLVEIKVYIDRKIDVNDTCHVSIVKTFKNYSFAITNILLHAAVLLYTPSFLAFLPGCSTPPAVSPHLLVSPLSSFRYDPPVNTLLDMCRVASLNENGLHINRRHFLWYIRDIRYNGIAIRLDVLFLWNTLYFFLGGTKLPTRISCVK